MVQLKMVKIQKKEIHAAHIPNNVYDFTTPAVVGPTDLNSDLVEIHVRSQGRNSLDGPVPLDFITRIESPSINRCLNFLHIPKTAGTTIEGVKERYRTTLAWGREDFANMKCRRPIKDKHSSCQIEDESGHIGHCSAWHVPPAYDSVLAQYYSTCDTFCVVRNPLTKALSEYVSRGKACDVKDFESSIEDKLTSLRSNRPNLTTDPFQDDCHWVSQVKYTGHKTFCQRVLKYETLESDFGTLMRDYGFNLTLSSSPARNAKHCDLSHHVAEVSQKTVDLIKQLYAEDYIEFGYH